MYYEGLVTKSIDSILWQDYRAAETGMVVYYATDPVSEVPIREVPEEVPSQVSSEPHYENGTFGFHFCDKPKVRSTFVKSKIRYLFFMTKYAGTRHDYQDQLVITGFYRINKTADVLKLHLRYLTDSACINADSCIALRAEEVHFVSLEDAFVITPEMLKEWETGTKVTKQTRIILNLESTRQLLDYLRSKPNAVQSYIDETRRLQPHGSEEESEEE